MADEAAYHGTWKIVECVSLAGTVEPTGIEGTEFNLDESGDVSWKVCDDAEPMPFFSCETYGVSMSDPAVLNFFGTYAGHFIEFRVEVSDDLMLLTYERCCMLQCQKISSNEPKDETPFSFLGALEEGYFSDLTIKDDKGTEFKVHKTILDLGVPSIDWSKSQTPLEGLREDVLRTTLHYIYSECLPRGLSEDTAKACIKAVGKHPGFARFTELCNTFLKNTALKQQIISLVTDMHACADKIIDLFNGKGGGSESCHTMDESLMANPAKLCYVVKQALREGAVAGSKLLILCDLFYRRKGELSREERHEIIKYAKSRFPVFMNQVHKFLEVCKQHSCCLTVAQRYEIATYLVPEIDATLDTISKFVVETKTALEEVINSRSAAEKATEKSTPDKHKKGNVGDVLGKTLKNALHLRELRKLKSFHDKTTYSFMNLMQKKENFSMMTQEEKVRSIAKNLEQLIDEVPLFLVRIEELMAALDEKVTWKDWKYSFKLGTSKVAWALNKYITHKSTLKAMIGQANDMVHREQFTHSLVTLGLLETPPPADGASSSAVSSSQASQPTKYAQLSSVESLCIAPYARDSSIARHSLELLKSGEKTDMVFEITIVQESGDVVIDHTHGEPIRREDHQREVDIHQVRAHCVVIAARCDWFRRALLSGMRESIDKKITVYDTNVELFRLFLEYLYSGQLETNELSTEQLADMMSLSDRYEMDCLKTRIEHALKHHLDEDSALFLLSLADQFHARSLKSAALNFIMEHTRIMDSEIFEDLPEHLQAELEDVVAWHGLEPRPPFISGHSHTETPSSMSSVSEVEELMTSLDLGENFQYQNDPSTSSSSEELHFLDDPGRMDACISSLRGVVGDSVPRDKLVQVTLAADYDVNRALNFLYPT